LGRARSHDKDVDSVFDLGLDFDEPDDGHGRFYDDFEEVVDPKVSKESAKEPTIFVTVSLCML
jgi:hypothetical protein